MTKPFGADVRLLAVDLDGTLVDSAPDLAYCLGIALRAVGLPAPSEAQTRSWIGDGVEELIRRALADALPGTRPDTFRAAHAESVKGSESSTDAPPAVDTFRTAFDAFSSSYAEHLFDRSRLYPHVAETLDTLLERGLRLCCITNKRIAFATGVLEQAGIADRFELVLGGDSLPLKKPSPAQLEAAGRALGVDGTATVLVGDSIHDFHAARAAGWRFVWAAYGYCPTIDAGPEDAVAKISTFFELSALFGGNPGVVGEAAAGNAGGAGGGGTSSGASGRAGGDGPPNR